MKQEINKEIKYLENIEILQDEQEIKDILQEQASETEFWNEFILQMQEKE